MFVSLLDIYVCGVYIYIYLQYIYLFIMQKGYKILKTIVYNMIHS